ncbi:MAG: 3D domain-containing protein [Bacillota bacterium]
MGSIILSLLLTLSVVSTEFESVTEAREAKNTTIRQDIKVVPLAKEEAKEVNELKEVKKESKEEKWMLFELTAFTNGPESTGKRPGDPGYARTASGTRTQEGRTIAADPKVLPIGTRVYIEGVGERIVEDTGSAIKGNKIDVFIEDLDRALEFGRKHNVKVRILD